MNKGMKITLIVFAIIGILFLIIVSFLTFMGIKSSEDHNEVISIADEFYDALKKQDHSKANTLLHPYINETVKQDFTKIYQFLDQKAGFIEAYAQIGVEVESFPSGRSTIIMTFDVNRTNSSTLDTLTFYREEGESKFSIIKYNAKSPEFVKKLLE